MNGSAITAGTSVSRIDLDAGRLTFVPKSNTTGTTAFPFQVRDDGGTERGGVDLDPSPNTITVKVVYCTYSDDDHDRHNHR